jgi:hypothetical protein
MIIDKVQAEAIEGQFKAIYTNKAEAKELNARNTEMFNGLVETIGCTKKEIRLAFKTWSEQFEDAPTSLEAVSSILDALEAE